MLLRSAATWAAALLLAGCASAPRHFMVASAHPLATDAGYEMLQAGGSAMDAGIAVQLVLTLVEPQSSGIGGGVFVVYHDGRQVQTVDGRETAPAAATPDLFMKNGQPMGFLEGAIGGRSVGVPGALRALEMAHRQNGKLPWAQLFEPAIRLAENGFAIGPRLAAVLRDPGVAESLKRDADAAAYFYESDGSPRVQGAVLRNPQLAAFLREVAQRGSAAMHEGPVARDIVAKVRGHASNPGLLTEADIASYRAKVREPVCFDYRIWRLCGMGPPSSGALALGQALGMLSGRDLAALPPAGLVLNPQAVHLITEAYRLAYADRDRYVGDPDFIPLPGGSAQALLNPAYLAQRASLIGERSMGRASPGVPLPASPLSLADDRSPELPSTSHVSVVDADGRTLAMTMTIENIFGSRLMTHGFMLNNELTDFSFVPSVDGAPVANRVEGGKRPRSSMSPTLVFDRASGQLLMSVGSPGGPFIITFVGKVLVGVLDWKLPVQQAMGLPNFGSRNGPTELESSPDTLALAEALRALGHEVRLMRLSSGLNGVQRDGDAWAGGTDPRGEGSVRGD